MASQLTLVFGTDEFRVSEKARELLVALAPAERGEMAREIVEADADTVDQATAALERCGVALQSAGLFAAEKTVFLKGVTFLGTDSLGKSERVKAALARFTELLKRGLPEGHSLLVSAGAVDKRSGFYKVFKAGGEVHAFAVAEKAYLAEREALTFARACFEREGIRAGAPVLDRFMAAVGTDSRLIAVETAKLAVYLGESRTARPDDIDAVTSLGRDAVGWDLAEAVGKRDLARALTVLRGLLAQKEEPIALVGMISRCVMDLLLLREAINLRWLQAGKSMRGGGEARWSEPPEAAAIYEEVLGKRDPRKVHPYRTFLLASQAAKYTVAELEACRGIVMEMHISLRSGETDPGGILETMLIRMLGRPVGG